MATARCTACGNTMNVSAQQLALLKAGVKIVHHGPNRDCSGGKFKVTLTEFLLARIAEDEEAAGYAKGDRPGRWRVGIEETGDGDNVYYTIEDGSTVIVDIDWRDRDPADHIARHDPARVLAECAAKRRIVEAYESATVSCSVGYELGFGLDLELRALASVYADHEQFRDEWR